MYIQIVFTHTHARCNSIENCSKVVLDALQFVKMKNAGIIFGCEYKIYTGNLSVNKRSDTIVKCLGNRVKYLQVHTHMQCKRTYTQKCSPI